MFERRMTREEIDAELENIATGCLGTYQFRTQAGEALEALRAGALMVTAGHTVYRVSDDDPDIGRRPPA